MASIAIQFVNRSDETITDLHVQVEEWAAVRVEQSMRIAGATLAPGATAVRPTPKFGNPHLKKFLERVRGILRPARFNSTGARKINAYSLSWFTVFSIQFVSSESLGGGAG